MKNSRRFISFLLVLTLALSTVMFSACSLFPGGGKPPISGGGGQKGSYSVSFQSGAEDAVGTAPETKTYEKGSSVKLPENPFTREGYTFKGWSDGSKVYSAGTNYTLGNDVVFTAVWTALGGDAPTAVDLDSKFYDAANWTYMTNNDGASADGGDIPYSMADGSIKFHKANQAIEIGDMSNATVSFMLKATNDFSIWFNSSSKDNNNNYSYRLAYAYSSLRIALSSAPDQAAALIGEELYLKGEWNRFDIVFSTVDNVTEIKVYINGSQASLSSGDNTTPAIEVSDNTFIHNKPAMFQTGSYMVVKVWEAHNFLQLKPVANAETEDLPIIACIGASITEGASAGDGTMFYTHSYPAQLQNALNGEYNVINYGNSGKTVRDDLGEESWLNQYQWVGVQAIVPDIAILNIGTNDSKTHNNPTHDGFYAAFKNLVDKLLLVNPNMQIIVCTVPYAYSDIWGISNDNIANIIAPVQREIAEEYDFTLVDLYQYTQGKSHLFPDGVHPNARGYEMIVKILKKALLEGEEALTEEFINAIHEEYKPLVPNAYVTVESLVIQNMTLYISGKTNDPNLRFYVGENPSESNLYNYYEEVDHDSEEGFTYSFDLTKMPLGTGWYNVRLYFTDGNYYTVSYTDLKDGEGNSIGLWSYLDLDSTTLQICSWDQATNNLSFNLTEKKDPDADQDEYFLQGGKVSEQNVPFYMVLQDDGKVHYGFWGALNGDASVTKTIELILTYEDPKEFPTSLDESKIVYTATNNYTSATSNDFSFEIDASNITPSDDWIRLVLKVTEGDTVSYYTIKPQVASHSGDWYACADVITHNGVKYEMAICWSSFFFLVKNA